MLDQGIRSYICEKVLSIVVGSGTHCYVSLSLDVPSHLKYIVHLKLFQSYTVCFPLVCRANIIKKEVPSG